MFLMVKFQILNTITEPSHPPKFSKTITQQNPDLAYNYGNTKLSKP
jgi:hypothetical protein